MKILLDTNILVRAAISPAGCAREILRLIECDETHSLVMSSHLLSEVADVLRRDRIQARWPLTDEEVRSYCHYLAQVSVEVSPRALPLVIHDPKDQAVVEAAVTASADVICTADAHFYAEPVLAFCAAQSIRIMRDLELLALLRGGRL